MSRLTVGLTGGVASGKSLVEAMFKALGVPVLDADQVSRAVVAPGEPALADIARVFGREFIAVDGTLDRARMRAHVFAQPAARQQLEALLHPRMFARMKDWRDAQTAPYCILSAAILLETGMRALVQRVLVVDTPESIQAQRLAARDGAPEATVRGIMAAQLSREARSAQADDLLLNDSSIEALQERVLALHQRYLAMAAFVPPSTQS